MDDNRFVNLINWFVAAVVLAIQLFTFIELNFSTTGKESVSYQNSIIIGKWSVTPEFGAFSRFNG